MEARIELDGETFAVQLREEDGRWFADVDGETFALRGHGTGLKRVINVDEAVFAVDARIARSLRMDGRDVDFTIHSLSGVAGAADPDAGHHGPIHPPMTGKLESIAVTVGQQVERGDVLFVLEAMKMRNEIKAPASGIIASIGAEVGAAVDSGTTILVLDPVSSD